MASAYEVTNVNEDNEPDPNGTGDFIDVFNITFTIVGRPGTFTVTVPLGGETVKQAFDAITAKVTTVDAIYAGASDASAG